MGDLSRVLIEATEGKRDFRRKEVNPVLMFSKLAGLFGGASREEGQTMAEYAVILGVITLVVLAALVFLSGNISTALSAVAGIV